MYFPASGSGFWSRFTEAELGLWEFFPPFVMTLCQTQWWENSHRPRTTIVSDTKSLQMVDVSESDTEQGMSDPNNDSDLGLDPEPCPGPVDPG